MLQPLGVTVIGALCFSVLLSLVATPVVYYILMRLHLRYLGIQPAQQLFRRGPVWEEKGNRRWVDHPIVSALVKVEELRVPGC